MEGSFCRWRKGSPFVQPVPETMLTFGPADCPRSIGAANPVKRIARNASRVPRQEEERIQSSMRPHCSLHAREQDSLGPAGGEHTPFTCPRFATTHESHSDTLPLPFKTTPTTPPSCLTSF